MNDKTLKVMEKKIVQMQRAFDNWSVAYWFWSVYCQETRGVKSQLKRKNAKPTLPERLIDILSGTTKPMSTQYIHDAAIKAGWQSKSKKKINVIFQTLHAMTTVKSIKTATRMND